MAETLNMKSRSGLEKAYEVPRGCSGPLLNVALGVMLEHKLEYDDVGRMYGLTTSERRFLREVCEDFSGLLRERKKAAH